MRLWRTIVFRMHPWSVMHAFPALPGHIACETDIRQMAKHAMLAVESHQACDCDGTRRLDMRFRELRYTIHAAPTLGPLWHAICVFPACYSGCLPRLTHAIFHMLVHIRGRNSLLAISKSHVHGFFHSAAVLCTIWPRWMASPQILTLPSASFALKSVNPFRA